MRDLWTTKLKHSMSKLRSKSILSGLEMTLMMTSSQLSPKEGELELKYKEAIVIPCTQWLACQMSQTNAAR